jgi:hypothetical protein
MEYLKKFDESNLGTDMIGRAKIGYTPNWKIEYINKRGMGWTTRISADDLLDLATKMEGGMSKEEYNSIYKITKY